MIVSTPVVISIIALLFYLILFWVTLTREGRSRLHLSFGLYLLSMIIWSSGSLMVFLNPPVGSLLLWSRIMVMGPISMPIAFAIFVQVFISQEWKFLTFFGVLSLIISTIANVGGAIFPNVTVVNGHTDFQYGFPAVVIPAITWALLVGFSTYSLIKEYYRTRDLIYRNRIKHLLLVLVVMFLGASTNATNLKDLPVDVAFNILSALLIANAILRHQLLDINLVVRKGLLYSIPTVIIGASYFLVISLLLRIFKDVNETQLFMLSFVVAILAAVVAQPLRDRAQSLVDRVFFREKFDSSLMLQRVSLTAATVLDLERLGLMILDEVISTLHVKRAAIFLKRESGSDYYMAAQRGIDGYPNLRFTATHPIVQHLLQRDLPLSNYDVNIMPLFKSLWGQEKEDLEQIGAELFIPLKAKGDLVGIFIVGPKLSELSYSEDDQLILTTLANQTAVAIENARLFSAEQYRRAELDALFSLTRQLIATDAVIDVLDITVRHVVESTHVVFARILTKDETGAFSCQAASPTRYMDYPSIAVKPPPPGVIKTYHQAVNQTEPLILEKNTPNLSKEDKKALYLDYVTTLVIFQLIVGNDTIGLLLVGEDPKQHHDSFDSDKMRLISAIAGQTASALQRARLHEQMEESFVQTVLALATASDARDTYTNDHSQRLASLAEATCSELGFTEIDIKAIHWAALLHDIGKIGIPDEILRKPGPLDDDEWEIMRRHPDIGARIVAPVKKLANVAPIIKAHHERYDGSGYPSHLKGEDIPLGARLLAVVDAYGAMTDDRVYRKTHTHAEAVAELKRCSGTQFDPKVVEAFLRVLDRNPARKSQPIIISLGIQPTDNPNKSGSASKPIYPSKYEKD